MKAKVDPEACIGCEACVALCPEVFEMDNDTAVAKTGPVPSEAEENCKDAATTCPTEAISIEE